MLEISNKYFTAILIALFMLVSARSPAAAETGHASVGIITVETIPDCSATVTTDCIIVTGEK